MLIRTAVAAATVAAALVAAAPSARAQIGIMMAHNYEIVLSGVGKADASRHRRASVNRVLDALSRRGYHNFRMLPSSRGTYRILAERHGRTYLITAGSRSGRILAIHRA